MLDVVQHLTLKDWLGLTVVGTAITVLGNFITLYTKEFLATRSFEKWKAHQALAVTYDRYRRPIASACEELSGRCYSCSKHYEKWREVTGLSTLAMVSAKVTPGALADDRYFNYKILSDAYRLCCFLAWIELYRRDLGLLNVNQTKHGRDLEKIIKNIRSALADGQLNYHLDWHKWEDSLIFREEQRAIGHRMIDTSTSLIDFGTFCEKLQEEINNKQKSGWFTNAVQFFSNLRRDQDFRLTRMKILVVHLTEARELLQPGSVSVEYQKGNEQLKKELADERNIAKNLAKVSSLGR